MKKYNGILRITAIIVAMTLLLCSCGVYNPPVGGGSANGSSGTNNGGTEIELPDNLKEDTFTVSLYYNGVKYVPRADEEIFAQWTDGFSVFSAKIESDGFARVSGLDGDYKVTISAPPESYSYNPNIYVATNDSKHIAIDLIAYTELDGKGTGIYTSLDLTKSGVYRLQFDSADEEVFIQFRPRTSGTYSIETWADTVANAINPKADVYNGSMAYKYYSRTLNDGGASSSYTKNIKYEVSVDKAEVGNVFTIALKLYSRDGSYPKHVDFALTLDGEFSRDWISSVFVYPTEDLDSMKVVDYDKKQYKIVGAETNRDGNVIFDSTMYKLWSREAGGDGYYHLYDENVYASNGGFGPILYAYISSACRYIDRSFSTIEYAGNKNLTLASGTENYKLFIEGYNAIVSTADSYYFCTSECPCLKSGKCDGACTLECAECKPECRKLPSDAIGMLGYADVCNSDGLCPVTEELRDFLQKYSTSQMLFCDGSGFVERSGVYALEEDQWLFACAYYVKK